MKIAIICAPQTFGCNTGMYSVDLAAWYFFSKFFPEATLQFLVLYPHKCDFGDNPIVTQPLLENPDIYESVDRIVFWGDFLHAYDYRAAIIQQLVMQGLSKSENDAKRLVRKFIYLSNADKKLLNKVVIYGGTMLFNESTCIQDAEYINDLKHLFSNCRRVWMREPYSALAIAEYIDNYTTSFHGTDCAQLLGRDFLKALSCEEQDSDAKPQKVLGLFLGRGKMPFDDLIAFLKSIKQNLNASLAWIDWGKKPFFLDRTEEIFTSFPELREHQFTGRTPLEILANLKKVDFVISDTYHVCVNAWNLGVPAICVIDNSHENLSVNSGSDLGKRDKRVAFYWTYNASPYLLYSSDLLEDVKIKKRVTELSGLLSNSENISFIASQMLKHASALQVLLADTIREPRL